MLIACYPLAVDLKPIILYEETRKVADNYILGWNYKTNPLINIFFFFNQ